MQLSLQLSKLQGTTSYFDGNMGRVGVKSDTVIAQPIQQNFLYTFSMAPYHKWDVKNGFAFMLDFFSLISDGLGGVGDITPHRRPQFGQITENPLKN